MLLNLYQLMVPMLYGAIGQSGALLGATVAFIRQMLARRMPKPKVAKDADNNNEKKEDSKTNANVKPVDASHGANCTKFEVRDINTGPSDYSHLTEEIHGGPGQCVSTAFSGNHETVVTVDVEQVADANEPENVDVETNSDQMNRGENDSMEILPVASAGNTKESVSGSKSGISSE